LQLLDIDEVPVKRKRKLVAGSDLAGSIIFYFL